MTSNTIDNTAVATRGTVVLGLMFAVPIAYTVLVLTLAAVSPSTAATLFHALEPVTEVVADFLPVTSRYSAQLIEHGYQHRVSIVRHLLPMQFLFGLPFFSYLLLVSPTRRSYYAHHCLTTKQMQTHILGLILGIGLFSVISITGTTIDFSDEPRRYTVRLHESNIWFFLSATSYPMLWMLFSGVLLASKKD